MEATRAPGSVSKKCLLFVFLGMALLRAHHHLPSHGSLIKGYEGIVFISCSIARSTEQDLEGFKDHTSGAI
jgi:hypothetical protein